MKTFWILLALALALVYWRPGHGAEPQDALPFTASEYAKATGRVPAWAGWDDTWHLVQQPERMYLCIEDRDTHARHVTWSSIDTFIQWSYFTGLWDFTPGVPVAKATDYAICWPQGRDGTWTWIAPTALENGDILIDLSHYLMYRQVGQATPTVYAQIDGRANRLVMRMPPEDFGACFYIVAVRKPATSPAVASDKSNTVCMDAQGQPLPTS